MEKQLKTPCFIFDEDKVIKNTCDFKSAINSQFCNGILSYSVKTNSYPSLLRVMNSLDCFAEVVSYTEYDLALQIGFPKNRIVYNGPAKDKVSFLDAIQSKAIVNIETFLEIEWLRDLPQTDLFEIGIRVNLNLHDISPEDCKDGEEFSRFGFSEESGDFKIALDRISKYENIKIAGLHLHRTTKTRNISAYQRIGNYAIQLVKKYSLSISYLDLGGGFYGDMPGKPTYYNYIDSIAATLSSYFDLTKLTVIVEPGNALAASAFHYCSSIIDIKKIKDNKVLVTDGTRNDIDPFFHKTSYFYSILNDLTYRNIEDKQVVVGCTCLENDRLFELNNHPQLLVGDIIKYHFVGAYTMCLSPLFIRYFPRVYKLKNSFYSLDREEWVAKDYICKGY